MADDLDEMFNRLTRGRAVLDDDPDAIFRRLTRQDRRLAEATEKAKDQGPQDWRLAVNAMPFGGAMLNAKLSDVEANAWKRYQAGEADADDLKVLATSQRQQELRKDQSVGRTVVEGLSRVPAIVGEMAVGAPLAAPLRAARLGAIPAAEIALGGARIGATAAASPSMYAEAAHQRAQEGGGEWTDPENLAPAFAHGAIQTAVLGRLGKPAGGVSTVAGRLAVRTGTGLVESEIAEAMAQASGLSTKYGTLTELARSGGENWKEAVSHAVTFAVFAGLHAKGDSAQAKAAARDKVLNDFRDQTIKLSAQGWSKERVGEKLKTDFAKLAEAAPKPAEPVPAPTTEAAPAPEKVPTQTPRAGEIVDPAQSQKAEIPVEPPKPPAEALKAASEAAPEETPEQYRAKLRTRIQEQRGDPDMIERLARRSKATTVEEWDAFAAEQEFKLTSAERRLAHEIIQENAATVQKEMAEIAERKAQVDKERAAKQLLKENMAKPRATPISVVDEKLADFAARQREKKLRSPRVEPPAPEAVPAPEATPRRSAADIRAELNSLSQNKRPRPNLTPEELKRYDELVREWNSAQTQETLGSMGLGSAAKPEFVAPEPPPMPERKVPVEETDFLQAVGAGPTAKAAPPRPEPVDHVAETAKRLAADDVGTIDPEKIAEVGERWAGKLRDSVNYMHQNWREMAGEMNPRTTDLNESAGNAMARHDSVRTFVRFAAPDLIDRVLGKEATVADRMKAGAVLTEMALRHTKRAYLERGQEGDLDIAANVRSIVGGENSPFQTEADFQAALADPRVRETIARYRENAVPMLEDWFRRAQGMEAGTEIDSFTQIPGLPVSLKTGKPGETGETMASVANDGGQRRGNLKNVRQPKLGAAKQRKGSAEVYDLDLAAMLEKSVADRARVATRREMVQALIDAGLAVRTRPNVKSVFNERVAKEVPGMWPGSPDSSLYVDPRVYGELRQSLAVDEPAKFPVLKKVMDIPTRVALASTVEAAYHLKNMGTFLFKPGVKLVDVVRETINVVRDSPETRQRIQKLAEIGAMKEPGMDSGQFSQLFGEKYGKSLRRLDPTWYMGQLIEVMQQSMRLAGDRAFDRLAKSGRVEGSEANRRNFINQLGQYNKAAQNKFIVALRDTGIGPFATAGSNYYVQSMRSLTMDPGVKATSTKAAIGLRAEMLAKVMAVVGSAAALNYFISGRVDGDDDTPLGAVRLGTTKDGKTAYFDLVALTGLTRGARQTGLLALAEGVRQDKGQPEIIDKAVHDAGHSVLHPGMGPGVNFLYTAKTGKNTMGSQVAEKAETYKGVKLESQSTKNVKAAVLNANPVLAQLGGFDDPDDDVPWYERLAKLLGPFGPKFRKAK